MAKEYKDLVVGLDIGTSKVMAVVAEVMPGGELKLVGLGIAASNGLKRGVVVNIDATVQSIQQALKEAELMADCKISRVYTGITGSHIRGLNSSGMVAVKDKEVTQADVARVIETAKAVNHKLLRFNQQQALVGRDVDGLGGFDHTRYIGLRDFLVLNRHHATRIEAAYMAAGDAGVDP